MPVVARGARQTGWTRRDIGFVCSGSSDYLAGRPFSFVMALDAVGPWPPIRERHVEMDGAWALYEAWVAIQTGEVDTALVYGFGKSSPGDIRRMLDAASSTRTTLAPLWPDSVSLAALQARAGLDAGRRDRGATSPRSRPGRRPTPASNPHAIRTGDVDGRRAARPSPMYAAPLRTHDCAPITDGARRASCSPPATSPASCASGRRGSAASTTASSRTSLGAPRPHPVARRPRRPRPRPASTGRRRRRRAARAVQPRGADPARGARPGRRRPRSTRRAARSPPTR